MKSRMLMSLLVIALAAALVGGATAAWFTDSASAPESTFTAGTLMVDVDQQPLETTKPINLDILNPGDAWGYKVDVKNSGTKNFYYKVVFCWQDQLGNTLVDFDGREGFGTNPLSEIVEFTIKDDADNVLTSGTLAGKEQPLEFEVGQLAPGAVDSYTVEAVLPTGADNKYQGSKMKIAFAVLAKQIHENALYPDFVCPLTQFKSTNYLNSIGEAPGKNTNPAPYVEFVGVSENDMTLKLHNDSYWAANFEIRVDGVEVLSDETHPAAGYYGFSKDAKLCDPNYDVAPDTHKDVTVSINNDTKKVEVRHAAGGESDGFFDWTPFFVVNPASATMQ